MSNKWVYINYQNEATGRNRDLQKGELDSWIAGRVSDCHRGGTQWEIVVNEDHFVVLVSGPDHPRPGTYLVAAKIQ